MAREQSIPSGVRSMAWTRTLRYVGWGFGESLIPVLIISLTGSYAAAGLIRSSYDVTLLLALPILGLLAERYPARSLVVVGLLLYPFVGIAYFLAGATGFVLFIVAARLINGVAYGLDATGINTYFRRLSPGGSIGSSFGFLDMLSNFGWIVAAIAGIWLVRYVPAHVLLLLVAPFSLIALPFALWAKRDHPALGAKAARLPLRQAYRSALREWQDWHIDLRLLALLLLFTQIVTVLIEFFVPIDIYLESHNLALVILFTVVASLPSLFGYILGKIADHRDKPKLAAFACLLMALILIALSLPIPYMLTVLGGLALGILVELLSIVQRSLATKLSPAEHYGRLDSVFQIIGGIGDLAAPPILGVALDLAGFSTVAAFLAAIAFFLAILFVIHVHPRRAKKPNLLAAIPPPEHAV